MTVLSDLQSVKILSDFSEPVLKKMERISNITTIKAGDYVFKENQYADKLYAVIEGKISLELNINSSSRCRIKDVFPCESFGISAIVDTGMHAYIADAIAVSNSRLFCWDSHKLEKLLYEDYEFGFRFMKNIAKILKSRLRYTRAQLAEGMCATNRAA